MKLLTAIRSAFLAALLLFAPVPALAAQATYVTPTTGPMSFSTFVTSYLNPALAAILSNNSGTTAPAVTGQPGTFQFWVDTSTTPRVLKLYDGTSWLALGTIDATGHLWASKASSLILPGSSSGTATIVPQAAAGTPTITLPTSTGTLADTVSAPLALDAVTGNLTVTGVAGKVLAGSTPAFTNTPTLGVAGASTGTLALTGVTSGTATITPQATAGSPTLTLPNATGTFADGATSPLALSATTGNLTCSTCVTSSGGGAASGTAPVAVSAAGVVSITGAAGQVLAGASPAFTPTPTLGVAGSTVGTVAFANASSGSITVSPPTGALGAVTVTLPDATDTLIAKATTDTLTNKTYDTAGSGNSFLINGVAATANTGTGAVARATSPAFTTPNIGVATATSVNKMAITAPATSSTLAVADGKTATVNNTLTLAGTDATTMTFPTTSATIARTDAANTFTGVQTMTSPALTTPAITGLATGSGVAAAATASTLATRDTNANLTANAFLAGYTTTATAAATTTLTVSSTQLQYFTGATTQTVTLPVASTLVLGQSFTVVNNSSGSVTVQSSGANSVLVVATGNTGIFTAILTSGTTAASWSSTYISSGAGTGTVTSVTCGTGLTGGTFTTTGTCALSTPVGTANGGTGAGNLNGLVQAGTTNTLTVGYTVTANSLGNITSFTVNPALGNYQYGTNHAAATWTAPTSDCAIDVLVTNDATAGTITFSGFTVGANTGDALTTTNGSKFLISIIRINGTSTWTDKALQ